MRIPHDRLHGLFNMGVKGVTLITSVYTLWLMSRKNALMRDDLKVIKKLYDTNYETYVPIEQILDKPVPAHCRRILVKDEFGRTRAMLRCGNVQDKFGERVYWNN